MANELSGRDTIFCAAIELKSPDERTQYLDRACQGNLELRREVQELVDAHFKAGSFLQVPAGQIDPTRQFAQDRGSSSPGMSPEIPGAVIGPYKLIQQIGEGGMGTVFLAQQTEPVKRLVALKVIKPGMDSTQVLARFEAERQALALMNHPNIAQVLDAGTTENGRPYFVMELVKGVTITAYCDEKRLTPRERLELFVPVCQAVQHAHQKGIIHRDLKPSNVLVALYDGRPVPKVIDFGVAKATGQQLTDRTLVTGFGALVGTLEYMSPEQAEINQLDVDTRSDVYSLGVLMYELLTGTTPLERKRLKQAALLEALRVIREEEPPRPSTRLSTTEEAASIAAARGVEPRRLSGIVRGELDWIVMKALEKDRARRYETANGLAADIQRFLSDEPVLACPPSTAYQLRKFVRRNKSGLSAAAIALLFVVALGSVLGWAVRDREARRATAEREQQARREKLAVRVDQILDELRTEYERDDLPEALVRLNRIDALIDDSQEVSEELRQRVEQWRSELATLQKLEEIEVRDNSLDDRFQQLDASYKQVFSEIGIDVDELPTEEAGRRIRSHLTRQRLTDVIDRWVWVRHQLIHIEKNNPAHRERRNRLLKIARAADDDEVRNRIRSMVGAWDREGADRLADSEEVNRLPVSSLAHLAAIIYWGGGETGRERAVQLLLDAQRKNPGSFRLNMGLWNYYFQMDPPRWAEAAQHAALALAIRPTSDRAEGSLAHCCLKLKKYDEALAHYSRLLERNPKVAAAHINLGNILHKQGKLNEAIACYRTALELNPQLAEAHAMLGTTLQDKGLVDEAIACYRTALELNPKFAEAHANLGAALKEKGLVDEAIACYRTALELNPQLAEAHAMLGTTLQDKGLHEEAIASVRRAIEINPRFARFYRDLGGVLHAQQKLDEAAQAWRRAIELDPDDGVACNNLAWLLVTCADESARDPARSRDLVSHALRLDRQAAGAHSTLGVAFYRLGEWAKAIEEFQKEPMENAGDAFFRAMAHWQLQQEDEARRWFQTGAQRMKQAAMDTPENRRFRAEAAKLLGISDSPPESP